MKALIFLLLALNTQLWAANKNKNEAFEWLMHSWKMYLPYLLSKDSLAPRVLRVLSVRLIVSWLSQKRLLLYLDLRMYGQLKFAF